MASVNDLDVSLVIGRTFFRHYDIIEKKQVGPECWSNDVAITIVKKALYGLKSCS